ncbi:unnamed protein product [Schistosoma intercalatum]|uniref:GABA(A) receptor-associated protein n=1 Tax=Schistosoma bovis TaxID=6184 RepID=A0A430QNZ1_SCHBO|nr:GABA(A) receptor-associated protein [Schistosoma bovis]CAH8590514.1 unnamed protein product [Schistosoma intercalatum]
MNFKFKETHTFEQRQQDSSKIKAKYPNRVPVVVERHRHSQIPDIDKHKFLVPDDVTVAQFMWIIRKRIDISSEKALFLFVEKNMPQTRYINRFTSRFTF